MRKIAFLYILTEKEMDQIQCEMDKYLKYKFLSEIPEKEPYHEEDHTADL